MKIGVIGAGQVGTACLLSLVSRGVADEIVVIDRNRARAVGVVADLQYGVPLASPVILRAGDYGDLAGVGLVLVTAGVNEKAGGATDRNDPAGRLKLLGKNAAIYREIVPQIFIHAPEAVILVVTDPPDPLAELARDLAGHDRVLGTGTFLDSLRFRVHLARRLRVHPISVDAQVLGEHGTSQVFCWSTARIGGEPVCSALGGSGEQEKALRDEIERDVRYANIAIIEGTGASQLGIGMVCARIAQAIADDEGLVIPVAFHQARYGTTLSLPAVVGRGGISRVLDPVLDDTEREALERSADAIRHALAQLEGIAA
jgi:L-lactate dehydrogenase